jgi:hypothetical protein
MRVSTGTLELVIINSVFVILNCLACCFNLNSARFVASPIFPSPEASSFLLMIAYLRKHLISYEALLNELIMAVSFVI